MLLASPMDEYMNDPRTKIIPKAAEIMFQTQCACQYIEKILLW